MENKNFIKTSDLETINLLTQQGFTFLSEDNGVYIFINDGKINFNDSDKKLKYTYTNTLFG